MQRGKEAKRQRNIKRIQSMHLCIYASMRLFTICCLLFTLICAPVLALEFDTSIDESIRKNYNPTKIEQDMALPTLPKIINENTVKQPVNVTKPQQPETLKPISKTEINTKASPTVYKQSVSKGSGGEYAVLKKGTKIRVKLLTNISDRTKKGTRVSFVSKYPVSTTYFTIPMGTVFKGEVIKSHKPQFAGNGGLIVLNIDSAEIKNKAQPINAYVTKANSKKIFFNNIKGKRRYGKSLLKAAKPGCNFFKKMMRVTLNLAQDGSSIVLTPFSVIIGSVTLASNVIVAPAVAVFYKGSSINIPAGSDFEIKLSEDVFIYN